MIFLKKINLKDFLSHEDTTLFFRSNEKLLINGVSGSGKTSIIEAIIWALYGKARVNNRFIVRAKQKKATVTLELSNNYKFYEIERSVTSDGKTSLKVSIKINDKYEPLKVSRVKELQEFIESELLHASYTLFINSVVYPQNKSNTFAEQQPSSRKKILLDMIDTSKYEDIYQKVNDNIASIETEILKEKTIQSSLLKENEKLEGIKEEYTKLKTKHTQLNTKLKKLETEKRKLEENLEEKNKAVLEIRSYNQDLEKSLNLVKEKEEKIASYIELSSNKVDYSKQISKLDEQKKQLELIKQDYEKSIEENNIWVAKKSSLPRKIDKLELEIALKELNSVSDRMKDLDKDNTFYCDLIDGICPRLKTQYEQEISSLIKMKSYREKKYLELLKKYEEYTKALNELPPEPKTLANQEIMYSKLDEVKKDLKKVEDGLNKYKEKDQEQKERVTKMEVEFQVLTNEVQKEKENIEKIKSIVSDTARIEREHYDATKELEKFMNTYNEVNKNINETALQLERAKMNLSRYESNVNKIEEIGKKLAEYGDRFISLELLKKAFGANGIKAILINMLIPKLEYKMNEFLSQLSHYKIKLATQKAKLSSDGYTDGLYITIYNDQGESFDYYSYSGGEKLKITVAISEALASIQRVGFRVLDELFIGLDEDSTEQFIDVMNKIQSKYSQIFCITHLRNIQDMFSERIMVTKSNGVSTAIKE